MNTDVVNTMSFITSELRASSPYRTGNMQRSIATIAIDDTSIEIVIAVDYASYVNEQTKHAHWIERVIERCIRCLTNNQSDLTSLQTGYAFDVKYGG